MQPPQLLGETVAFMGYADRRRQGDRCIPAAQRILAEYFVTTTDEIKIAPTLIDMREGTDLLYEDIRISLRTRQASYLAKYPHDVTFRLSVNRHDGGCEWSKVEAGYVGYMLYGFEDQGRLVRWVLVDLSQLLAVLSSSLPYRVNAVAEKSLPGTEPFKAINLSKFSPEDRVSIVVAEGGD